MNLNKRIAEKKGLRVAGTDLYYAPIPDYINDPVRILELQDELLEDGWILTKNYSIYEWSKEEREFKGILVRAKEHSIENKHYGTATAMAWLEAFGG